MGNTSSTDKHSTPGNSPRDATHAAAYEARDTHNQKKAPRRRESIPALPHGRASVVPPSASLESAQGQSSSQNAAVQAHSQRSNHSRGRSQTSATVAKNSQREAAGSAEGGDRDATQEALPVRVPKHPIPTDPNIQRASAAATKGSPTSPSSYHMPQTQFHRPPRLPLPIEQEDLAPGSPIISPADLPGPIGTDLSAAIEGEAQLERKGSVLSSTTVDDDEMVDDFQAHGKASGQMVDTLIEWKEGGDRVYVTGSFSGWTKKQRLHRNGPSKDPNALSAVIPLVVGTHHLTFLVDGQMRTSRFLPTAVDYTNVLINYIEVTRDAVPSAAQPVDIQRPPSDQRPPRPAVALEPHRPTEGQQMSTLPPPTPDLKPTHRNDPLSAGPSGIAQTPAPQAQEQEKPPSRPVSAAPHHTHPQKRTLVNTKPYHSEIPSFLQDFEANETSLDFRRANAVMGTQPVPPALPMFLNKSILNGTLPMKDDASVLILPNHTVLNHLATTSIKNHVLATSATTRYKRKYVTTIMHRPTNTRDG